MSLDLLKCLRLGREKIKTIKKSPKKYLLSANFDRQVWIEVFKFEGSVYIQWLLEPFLFLLQPSSLLQLRNFRSCERCKKKTVFQVNSKFDPILGGEGESFRARHYSHFEASISGRPLKLVS
jgi:hypothetical protein